MNEARLEYLARHRQGISIAVALIGSILGFLMFGGTASGWGNFFAAGSWALGLWIGTHLVVNWLTAGTAESRDIRER
jgi:hypothetical protein